MPTIHFPVEWLAICYIAELAGFIFRADLEGLA